MRIIKTLALLLAAPIFFIGCMIQATVVALFFVLIAQPFGSARVFKVGYEEPKE